MLSTGPTPQGSKLLHRMTSLFKKKKQPHCDHVGEDEVCYGLYLHNKVMHVMIMCTTCRYVNHTVTSPSCQLS